MLLVAMVYYPWAISADLPGLRLASLVLNRSWQLPGFISLARYRLPVLPLVDFVAMENRSCSKLQ